MKAFCVAPAAASWTLPWGISHWGGLQAYEGRWGLPLQGRHLSDTAAPVPFHVSCSGDCDCDERDRHLGRRDGRTAPGGGISPKKLWGAPPTKSSPERLRWRLLGRALRLLRAARRLRLPHVRLRRLHALHLPVALQRSSLCWQPLFCSSTQLLHTHVPQQHHNPQQALPGQWH